MMTAHHIFFGTRENKFVQLMIVVRENIQASEGSQVYLLIIPQKLQKTRNYDSRS